MDFVVVDTDVASNIHKDRLPDPMASRLVRKSLVVMFVTIGELTQWVELRRWGAHRRTQLDMWLDGSSASDLAYAWASGILNSGSTALAPV